MKAYRTVRDEPIGVAIGFKPEGEVADEYELAHDSGGEFVFIDGDQISIWGARSFQTYRGRHTAEPDLLIWRSPEEFAVWKREMDEG